MARQHGFRLDKMDAARRVLAGYAFATQERPVDYKRALGIPGSLTQLPTEERVYRWGYAVYDCIPAQPGKVDVKDIAVALSLNAQSDVAALSAACRVAQPLSDLLGKLDGKMGNKSFWDYWDAAVTFSEDADCSSDTASAEDLMLCAWGLLRATPELNLARTHKILHHLRPRFFPLIDNDTADALPSGHRWATIHHDLTTFKSEYLDLEEWFARLCACVAANRGAFNVPSWPERFDRIERLRMYDILLWSQVVGQWDAATKHGERILRAAEGLDCR